jgi:hypothetical protein
MPDGLEVQYPYRVWDRVERHAIGQVAIPHGHGGRRQTAPDPVQDPLLVRGQVGWRGTPGPYQRVLGGVGDLDDLQYPPGREVQQRRARRLWRAGRSG